MKLSVVTCSFAIVCLLFLFSCGPGNDTKTEAPPEPKIFTEVVPTKDGDSKLKHVTEGAKMPQGMIKALGSDEFSSTKSFAGKALVINFWASWCSPCLTDTPAFQKIAAEFPEAEFISVSIDKSEDVWKTFIKDNQWTGNHYWMGRNEADPFYSFVYSNIQSDNVNGVHVTLPRYAIVDQAGTILVKNFPGPGTPLFKETLDKQLL